MNRGRFSFRIALFGQALALLVWLVAASWTWLPAWADPEGGLFYVAPGGACGGAPNCYANVQDAVDSSASGDEIRVAAGTYTGVTSREGGSQMVYLDKGVTIRGGYATTDWTASYPVTRPTTLDAQGQGRVFHITGDISPVIEGLRLVGGNAAGEGLGRLGGGVYILSATAVLRDNLIFNNTAGLHGGGVFLDHSAAILIGNSVISNTTPHNYGNGGGLSLSWSPAILDGNTIMSNTAHLGAGLNMNVSDARLTSNTIAFNFAFDVTHDGYTFGGAGGGLNADSSAPTLTANSIVSNRADWGGGMYLNGGSGLFASNTFSGNIATAKGGAAYVGGGFNSFVGNAFLRNQCDWGGALVLSGSAGTARGNSFIGNMAPWRGGGLMLEYSGATLSENVIISNTSGQGGGIFFFGSAVDGANAQLTNNVIAGNHAPQGSGLYVWASSPGLVHNTIARNTGDGVGLLVDSYPGLVDPGSPSTVFSAVALTNTIIVSQTIGVYATVGNTVTLNSILWYSVPVTVAPGITTALVVQNQTTGNPAFAADGYHLTASSAARGWGVNAGVGDIDGEPRRNPPDLGADEFWAPGELKRVYLPLVLRNP
jgi:hypothetical protein